MKRYKAMTMLCLLFGLLLCACSAPAEPAAGESEPAASQSEAAEEISLTPVTPFGVSGSKASAKEGFYRFSTNPQAGGNIIYTDYSTKTTVYLCNRPECRHNDETCPSWFDLLGGDLFLDAKGEHLFCAGWVNSEQEQTQVIWKMDANGENREKLYTCAPNESLVDMVISDGTSLYFVTGVAGKEIGKINKTLKQIDIQTGKTEDLMSYQDMEWLVGAFENELLILSSDGKSYRYDAYSPETKTARTLFVYDINAISQPSGDSIYLLEPITDGTAEVLQYNMKTGEKVSLCQEVPYFGSDTTRIENIVDGRIVIHASDTRENDPEKIKHYHYAVDCKTGEMTDLPLTYTMGEMTDFVPIVAGADEFFVVISGTETVKSIMTGTDGTPYEAEGTIFIYSLISKSDYWNGQPNYIEIDDSAIKQS